MATKSICSVADCDKPAERVGFCWSHYFRNYRYGDPSAGRTARGSRAKYLYEVAIPYDKDDCLIWPYSRTKGYGSIALPGRRRSTVTHIICEAVHGPAPTPKHHAAHSCGNGRAGCCNPRHLSWKTAKENIADTVIHGTSNRGERCGSAKLTADQVRKIRALKGQATVTELARTFGVSRRQIRSIQQRTSWAWLE
jgi:hypothetical protein